MTKIVEKFSFPCHNYKSLNNMDLQPALTLERLGPLRPNDPPPMLGMMTTIVTPLSYVGNDIVDPLE